MHFVLFLFVFILNLPTSVHLPRPDKKAGTNGVRSWEVSLYMYMTLPVEIATSLKFARVALLSVGLWCSQMQVVEMNIQVRYKFVNPVNFFQQIHHT